MIGNDHIANCNGNNDHYDLGDNMISIALHNK